MQDNIFNRYLQNASRQTTRNEEPPFQPEITIVNIQPDDDGDNRWVEVTKTPPPPPSRLSTVVHAICTALVLFLYTCLYVPQ